MDLPCQSLDLNIIEVVWDHLDRQAAHFQRRALNALAEAKRTIPQRNYRKVCLRELC